LERNEKFCRRENEKKYLIPRQRKQNSCKMYLDLEGSEFDFLRNIDENTLRTITMQITEVHSLLKRVPDTGEFEKMASYATDA
jgi:hypothetical protein